MEKLSGLTLDVHDDSDGSILRQLYPTLDDVPAVVKTAAVLDDARRGSLPDDLFALVLKDGDTVLRKYACADAGNTVLSTAYFMKTAGCLPVEAQKLAAKNLLTAHAWYGIPASEGLQKIALGLATALNIGMNVPTVMGAKKEISNNLRKARVAGGAVDPSIFGKGHGAV